LVARVAVQLVDLRVNLHETNLLIEIHFVAQNLIVLDNIHTVVGNVPRCAASQIVVGPYVPVLVVAVVALDEKSLTINRLVRRSTHLLAVNVPSIHRDVVLDPTLVVSSVLVCIGTMCQFCRRKSPES
jgi:hypothetical protein